MLLSRFNLGEVAQAVQGAWHQPHRAVAQPIARVCTDSRQLQPGDLFLALKGERFDGHAFLQQAAKVGVAAVIVHDASALDHPALAGIPALVVDDTLKAYGQLANAVRRRGGEHGLRVVGVAGSSGKTTTKELLAAMLRASEGDAAVLASTANNNNLIGVPMTLLALEERHTRAVIEAGMNEPGELARLAATIQPDIAVLTGINSAHVGQFRSRNEHFEAKFDWLRHVPNTAAIVLNADCPGALRAAERLGRQSERVFYAGEAHRESVARIHNVQPVGTEGYDFELELFGRRFPATLPLFGRYNLQNVAVAAVAATLLGAREDAIAAACASAHSPKMRGETREIAGRTLVVDCYNAAPEAMRLALASAAELAARRGTKALALLGDMGELGPHAEAEHASVGHEAARLGLMALAAFGPQMEWAATEARRGGIPICHHTLDIADAAAAIFGASRPGDVILLKGSRYMALERALPFFDELAQAVHASALTA